jgi:hypothetical protein
MVNSIGYDTTGRVISLRHGALHILPGGALHTTPHHTTPHHTTPHHTTPYAGAVYNTTHKKLMSKYNVQETSVVNDRKQMNEMNKTNQIK